MVRKKGWICSFTTSNFENFYSCFGSYKPVCVTDAQAITTGKLIFCARSSCAVLVFIKSITAVSITITDPCPRNAPPEWGLIVGTRELCCCAVAVCWRKSMFTNQVTLCICDTLLHHTHQQCGYPPINHNRAMPCCICRDRYHCTFSCTKLHITLLGGWLGAKAFLRQCWHVQKSASHWILNISFFNQIFWELNSLDSLFCSRCSVLQGANSGSTIIVSKAKDYKYYQLFPKKIKKRD